MAVTEVTAIAVPDVLRERGKPRVNEPPGAMPAALMGDVPALPVRRGDASANERKSRITVPNPQGFRFYYPAGERDRAIRSLVIINHR